MRFKTYNEASLQRPGFYKPERYDNFLKKMKKFEPFETVNGDEIILKPIKMPKDYKKMPTKYTTIDGDEILLSKLQKTEEFGGEGSKAKRSLPKRMTSTVFLELFASLGAFGIDMSTFNSKSKDPELSPGFKLFDNFDWMSPTVQKEAIGIASSTNKFIKQEGIKSPFVIWKSINEFYSILAKLEGVDYIKDNTADIVIIENANKSSLFGALNSKEPISYDKISGRITVGKISFYMVSLKKAEEGARMGRVTKLFQDLFMERNQYIEEGLLDSIRSIGTASIKFFLKLKKSFYKFVNYLTAYFDPKKLEARGKHFSKYYMNESLLENSLRTEVNQRMQKLMSYNSQDIHIQIETAEKEPKESSRINLLKANAVTGRIMEEMLNRVKAKDASVMIAEIIELMKKGSTKLPIVIVYGDGKSIVVDKIKPVVVTRVPTILFNALQGKNSEYLVTYLYFVAEPAEDINDIKYIQIQMTNSGGGKTFSYKVEGAKTETFRSIRKKFKL